MTLEPQPRAKRDHDKLYTTLLGVLGFLLILGIISLNAVTSRTGMDENFRSVARMSMELEGCLVVAIVAVLLIRILSPAYRRWPTLGLNIVLLAFVPLGTALGIYGLLKADKHMPEISNCTSTNA